MKLRLLVLFLAVATISFAQKKEMKKIEKAVKAGKIQEAVDIFKTINESEVEEKYKAQYEFYKAASLVDVTGATKPTLDNTLMALESLNMSEKLGYSNPVLQGQVKDYINQTLITMVNEKLNGGDNKSALKIINVLSNNAPDDMNMLFNAANVAYQAGEFSQAKTQYEKLYNSGFTGQLTTYTAVNKQTNQEEVFPSKQLRDVSVQTGSHSSPSEQTSSSQLGRIVTNLVWLYKNDGDVDKAKSTFEQALSKYPNDASLKIAKADNYLTLEMMDEYKEAAESLTKEVKDPAIYDNLASAALKTKSYDEAIKYYGMSLSLEPNNFNAVANTGFAYLEKGNLDETTAADQDVFYKKSISFYEKAHEIDTENKTVITTLINLYQAYGMEDKVSEMKAKL